VDYNTTPPCGTVRVYTPDNRPLDIRGFYLFVCQEPVPDRQGHYRLSALALCDGNLLNADFEYYLSIVGSRKKKLGVGSYADGADRSRPMLIFANPLGISELDRHITLVHSRDDLDAAFPQLRKVGNITRSLQGQNPRAFHCYRLHRDTPKDSAFFSLLNPFPTPFRTEKTQARGRFRIDISPTD
jgi:hypothetical protein